MDQFEAYSYFNNIQLSLKLTKGFHFARISDPTSMEEVINNFTKYQEFFCIDDTNDGVTVEIGGGFFERRIYIVHLIKNYSLKKKDSMTQQKVALEQCRQIYRKVVSKLIADKEANLNGLRYLNTRIPFYEYPKYMFTGATGIYFIVSLDVPTDLCYKPEDWDETELRKMDNTFDTTFQ